jgi:bacillithiol biosynthesis deacetylase BshB1
MTAAALDVLVIAPHPDDAELGAAGMILKLQAEGRRVGVLDLTDGEPTPHGSPEIRARETAAATAVLELAWRENLGLPNRRLEATLDARAQLAGVIRQQRPGLLLAPYWVDSHPDHVAATELIEAARFWAKLSKTDLPGQPHHPATILYYFCVHLRQVAAPAFVLDISQQWERKMRAIRCYESQFVAGRSPVFLEQLRDEASYWGRMIGTAYGEPFASREPIALSGLGDLL